VWLRPTAAGYGSEGIGLVGRPCRISLGMRGNSNTLPIPPP
jgi:hypothetical protein